MDIGWIEFLSIIVIAFAIVMIIAGLFTAYFGSGKGRTIGLVMVVVGLIVGAVWIWLCNPSSNVGPFCEVQLWDVIRRALVDLIGIIIGALVAVGIFLVGVMKS